MPFRRACGPIEHAQLDEETVEMMRERWEMGDEVYYCPTMITQIFHPPQ